MIDICGQSLSVLKVISFHQFYRRHISNLDLCCNWLLFLYFQVLKLEQVGESKGAKVLADYNLALNQS